ncbi:hypothetical protein PRUPE_1G296800 [Prunus persica]|uniref:Uncharacterized protein n=1 Tax=Prunus persica TaxID=3760 RepID=M5Y0H0_PRUPE|nr:hypothetical protein PRUPE_1G296800 [Prunus persica]
MGGSKGSNSNSNSQVGNQNAGWGNSSNVAASGGGGGGNAAGNMKAPGRDYAISRESFESNPAAYFKDLRK